MRERRCDVLVVGGGPAGAAAAWAAARAGADVLVVERRPVPGEPVQCGEWVPRLIRRDAPLPGHAVAAPVAGMRTHVWVGGGWDGNPDVSCGRGVASTWEERYLAAPGYMIHRALFDRHLLDEARAAGAEVWPGAAAVAVGGGAGRERRSGAPGGDGPSVVVRRAGETIRVRARVVVGADGARSTVGAWLGLVNRSMVLAVQRELPCSDGGGAVEVYLHPRLAGGYGWFFPKGPTANVGVGVNPTLARREELPGMLRWLVDLLQAAGKVTGPSLRATGGWIPVGGMLPEVVRGPFLLAGDAAGLAHPITGAGIHHAVVSGRLAGAAAAEAARKGDGALAGYGRRLAALLGEVMAWGAARREARDASWGRGDFAALMDETWVGCGGFWAGRRSFAGGPRAGRPAETMQV